MLRQQSFRKLVACRPNSAWCSAQVAPNWAEFGPVSVKVGHFILIGADFSQIGAEFSHVWREFGQFGRFGPILALISTELARGRSHLGPTVGRARPRFSRLRPLWAELDLVRTDFGQVWWMFAKTGPSSTNTYWTDVGRSRLNMDGLGPDVHPSRTDLGQSLARAPKRRRRRLPVRRRRERLLQPRLPLDRRVADRHGNLHHQTRGRFAGLRQWHGKLPLGRRRLQTESRGADPRAGGRRGGENTHPAEPIPHLHSADAGPDMVDGRQYRYRPTVSRLAGPSPGQQRHKVRPNGRRPQRTPNPSPATLEECSAAA